MSYKPFTTWPVWRGGDSLAVFASMAKTTKTYFLFSCVSHTVHYSKTILEKNKDRSLFLFSKSGLIYLVCITTPWSQSLDLKIQLTII